MKVSVIVPVYNTAKYLKQCLQSLSVQTLKDIEIICVNDGSTDNSQQIIDHFTAADHRFKAIHKSNTGYGHSVNMGIRAAQGQYIGIVESDDFAEPDMFRSLYDAAERNQVDFVKGNYNTYRENAACPAVFEDMLGKFPYHTVFSPQDNPGIFGVHPSVWASLYRKSFLEENDIWFQETPGASYQDIAFAFKVNAGAKRLCFIEEAVLNYRVDNAGSSVHNPQKIFCVCDELKEIERYIRNRAGSGAYEAQWLRELEQIAAWIKYRNYMWNYTRLSLPYQYTFLMKVQEELKDIRNQGFESQVWNEGEKETLKQIVDSPDSFFVMTAKGYEDSRISIIPVLNHSFSVRCFQQLVAQFGKIYLYGAGRIGQRVWTCLKLMDAADKVKGFIVSEAEKNPENLDGKHIFVFPEIQKQIVEDALVIVAVHSRHHYEIALKLQTGGCKNILLIDEKIKSWIYENTDAAV